MPITEDDLAERGGAIVRAASACVEPPLELRERIEAERARAGARQRRFALRLGVVTGVVAVLVGVVLEVGGGADPSLDEAAALSLRAPTDPAPSVDARRPQLLAARHAGVAYPNWGPKFGWRAVGVRRDSVDGRDAATVYYRNSKGAVAGYTIVAGEPLDGTGGRDYVAGDRRVVTFERGGHTCVVTAPLTVKRDVLLDLARWSGKGAVRF